MTASGIVLETSVSEFDVHQAELVDAGGLSSIKVVDLAQAGPAWKFAAVHSELVSVGVVSDTQLMEADRLSAMVDLVDHSGLAAVHEIMNDAQHNEFAQIADQLAADLPMIQKGLAGELAAGELGDLIRVVQSHLLDLNTAASDLFGDIGQDVSDYSNLLQVEADIDLIGSVQVDALELTDAAGHELSAVIGDGHMPTLEALFTSPESFPATLDFSDQEHFDSSLDYFSGSSSISSDARGDAGSDPIDGSSSDLS